MQAPVPSHILRTHAASVTAVAFSPDNERLYSGDGSGLVVITSTRSLRPIAAWSAHTDGILGVQEWAEAASILTHGRDNKLHVWARILAPHAVGDAAASLDLPTPTLRYSMDVNALNFCRFSLLLMREDGGSSSSTVDAKALVAIPNLVESSLMSGSFPHAQGGMRPLESLSCQEATGAGSRRRAGILMSLHIFMKDDRLHLISAYESGEVILRRYAGEREVSIEGRNWECVWRTKQHNESVMAMTVSKDCAFAISVSADHTVARYDLQAHAEDTQELFVKYRIKQAGNASVALRHDGRVCAIGGWDGKIRLFSTKSFMPLGTLSCHTKSCQALAFAHPSRGSVTGDALDEADDELTEAEEEARSRWLSAGSQDNRLTIWELMDFRQAKHTL